MRIIVLNRPDPIVRELLHSIERRLDKIMATQVELQAEVGRLTTNIENLEKATAAEKEQVAAGFKTLTDSVAALQQEVADLKAGQVIDQATLDSVKAAADKVEADTTAVSDIFTP